MHIVFFETTVEDSQHYSRLLPDHQITYIEEPLSPSTVHLAKGADVISVFVNSTANTEVILGLSGTRAIITRSTGFDHIDCKAAAAQGITVCNVPSYGSRTVAEFAFALILNLSRHAAQARIQLLETNSFDIRAYRGFDLQGKTIGIIGTGRIGKNAIRLAQGFDMRVIAYDVKPDEAYAAEHGFTYTSLDELLTQSDVVSVHAPCIMPSADGPGTYHLLNATNIPRMKTGVVLINTSRGELIETEALIAALERGQMGGVGLDVLEEERALKQGLARFGKEIPKDDANYRTLYQSQLLVEHPAVMVTPHIAFFSAEAEMEIVQTTVENIQGISNNSPINIIHV